jgi:hypothetical protein
VQQRNPTETEHMEVSEMKEACFCGRASEIEDREPVQDGDGQSALRCPSEACGHLDHEKTEVTDGQMTTREDHENHGLEIAL